MTDPKTYSIEEASRYVSAHLRSTIREPLSVERVLATAQAAAEADSLRAQLEEAQRQLTDGRRLTEQVISERDSTKAQLAEMDAAFQSRPTAAALTAAQGEVAVLRVLVKEAWFILGGYAEFNSRDAGRLIGVSKEIAPRLQAAIASTRATADAHDERVRREALEAVHSEIKGLYEGSTGGPDYQQELQRQFRGGIGAALTVAAELLNRALTHPTKEPT